MYLNIQKVSNFTDVQYKNFNKPILISKGCKSMNAVNIWNINNLKKIFNNTLIDLEVYKNKKLMGITQCKNKNLSFNKFIDHCIKDISPYYYFAEYPIRNLKNKVYKQIKSDVTFKFDKLRKSRNELIFIGFNSMSGCHLHVEDDFLLNQLVGKKSVYLFDYYDNPKLSMNSFFERNSNFLKDNLYELSHNTLKIYKVVLEPGDSLMIPPWWFHSVMGHEFSCSITKIYRRSDYRYYQKYYYLAFLNFVGEIEYYRNYIIIFFVCLILLIVYRYWLRQRSLRQYVQTSKKRVVMAAPALTSSVLMI